MKNTIQIGHVNPGNLPAKFDVAKLIKTRLLICANSGGGKSWLMRLIAELLFGIMPVIIFDIEGEFATLREKFDFVLVGPNGETPADCRSAKLVIQKLLELRASAVIDLSEMEPRERHRYIRLAAEAAINSPKNLWRPTAFMFDEAHEVCPENGKGESEAKGAVLAFATKGRKRQFLAIFATQRVHKLALDCRAECLNRMIGMTFEPDDLKVAASILGISGKDGLGGFNRMMRTMEEGNFYTFGRAISLTVCLVKVGQVQTRHGIQENQRHKAPPTPDNIKALLPKLADLPQLADEQAKTEKELKQEVADLRRKLKDAARAVPAVLAPKVQTKTEKIIVIRPQDLKLIRETAANQNKVLQHCAKITARVGDDLATLNRLTSVLENAQKVLESAKNGAQLPTKQAVSITTKVLEKAPPVLEKTHGYSAGPVKEAPQLETVEFGHPLRTPGAGQGEWREMQDDLKPGEIKVLSAVAQYPDGLKEEQISVLTGYRRTTRYENLKALKRKEYVTDEGGIIRATQRGIAALGDDYRPLPTGEELIAHWRKNLTGGELRIFEFAIQRQAPFDNGEELQAAVNMKRTSCYEAMKALVARHILTLDNRQYSLSKMLL